MNPTPPQGEAKFGDNDTLEPINNVEVLEKGESVSIPWNAEIGESSAYGLSETFKPVAEISLTPEDLSDPSGEARQKILLAKFENDEGMTVPVVFPLYKDGRPMQGVRIDHADKSPTNIGRLGVYRGEAVTSAENIVHRHVVDSFASDKLISRTHVQIEFGDNGISIKGMSNNLAVVEFGQPKVEAPVPPEIDDDDTIRNDSDQMAELREAARVARESEQRSTAEQLIRDQAAQLEAGEGVEHVVEFSTSDGEHDEETSADEQIAEPEEEPEPDYLTEDELLADHFEDLLRNRPVEGANPQMESQLTSQLRMIESRLGDAIRDADLNTIGAEFRERVSRIIQNSESLDHARGLVTETEQALEEYAAAAAAVANTIVYGGLSAMIEDGSGMRFKNARERLGVENHNSAFNQLAAGAGEGVFGFHTAIGQEVEQTMSDVRQRRSDARIDEEDLHQEFIDAWNQGGKTIDGLQQVIFNKHPNYTRIRSDIEKVEDLERSLNGVSFVVENQDFMHAAKVFRNEAGMIQQRINPNNIQIDPAELSTNAARAAQLAEDMRSFSYTVARAQAIAQEVQ